MCESFKDGVYEMTTYIRLKDIAIRELKYELYMILRSLKT